jgi:hypothetical protein
MADRQSAILLGAGFSTEFGVPTMRPFFTDFLEFAARQYPNRRDTINGLVGQLGGSADLESLLSKLQAAVEVGAGLPPEFDPTPLQAWMENARALRSHLLSYIVERCEQFDRAKAESLCGSFLRHASETDTALFSTNYDRIIEHVCEKLDIELADGFAREPGDLANVWNAEFGEHLALAKLHGSVTWYTEQQDPPHLLSLGSRLSAAWT